MINITREEAKIIRRALPDVPIKPTRYKRYVEERPDVMRIINSIRNGHPEAYPPVHRGRGGRR